MWRGGLGQAYPFPVLSVAGASLAGPCSVSIPARRDSSNRTCGFAASGSPTNVAIRHTPWADHLATSPDGQAWAAVARSLCELVGRSQSHDLCPHSKRVRSQAPFLDRHYPASSVLRACPPPHSAPPVPHGLRVGGLRHHRWGFPCCDWSPCACMLSPLPRRDRWVLTSLASPAIAAFREFWARRLPHYPFRGLLDVHCSLRPACSLNRLAIRLSECFNGCRCLHPPLRGLPAGATFAGRELHPLKTSALSRRTRICGC